MRARVCKLIQGWKKMSVFTAVRVTFTIKNGCSRKNEATALQPRKVSPPDTSDDPIDHKQGPGPSTDLFVPINTPPSIHRHQTSHQLVTTEIKYGSITDVRKRAQMQVSERFSYSLVVGQQWCYRCAS